MRLPKGAFRLPDGAALMIDPVTGGSPTGKVSIELWSHYLPSDAAGWAEARAWLITRAQARKLIRKLLKANEIAEACERAERIVRRHS
jgi:hypothetical protein